MSGTCLDLLCDIKKRQEHVSTRNTGPGLVPFFHDNQDSLQELRASRSFCPSESFCHGPGAMDGVSAVLPTRFGLSHTRVRVQPSAA